jgi:2'-5' RNA ligase
MKTHQQNPGWLELDLRDHMLLANPDETVYEKVMEEKKYFEDKYETEVVTKTLPHITIANFFAKEILGDRIGRLLQNICNQHYSFSIALNNFSGFPPHTVFIRVQDPQPFKRLSNGLQALDDLLQINGCPPLQLSGKPHIILAEELQKDIYNTAIK